MDSVAQPLVAVVIIMAIFRCSDGRRNVLPAAIAAAAAATLSAPILPYPMPRHARPSHMA